MRAVQRVCCFLVFSIFFLWALGLGGTRSAARGEDDADNEAVESQRLREDKDEDHAGEQLGLLGVSAHAGVADDADGHAGGEAREAARQTRGEVRVPLEQGVTHGVNCDDDDDERGGAMMEFGEGGEGKRGM